MVFQWSYNQSGATGGLPASAKLTNERATLRTRLQKISAVLIAVWLCLFTPSLAGEDQAEQFETARVHLQTGRYEEALEAYDRLTRAKADAAAVAIGKSRAYEAQGRWREATDVLETAVKAVPNNAGLWARLAQIQFLRGRYRIAEQSVNNALEQDGDQPLARLVRAELLTETGRIKQANEEFRWFVGYYNRKQPEDAESLLLVARGAVQ